MNEDAMVLRDAAMALAWIVCGAVTALVVLVLVDERKKHKPLDAVPYALIVLAGPLIPLLAFCFASAYFAMSFLLSLFSGDPK